MSPVCCSWFCPVPSCSTTTSTRLLWPSAHTQLTRLCRRTPHTQHTPLTHPWPPTLPRTLSTQLSRSWRGCRSLSARATKTHLPAGVDGCVRMFSCVCVSVRVCACVSRLTFVTLCDIEKSDLLFATSTVRLRGPFNKYFFTSTYLLFLILTTRGQCRYSVVGMQCIFKKVKS